MANEFSQQIDYLNGGPTLKEWGPYPTKEAACLAIENKVDAEGRNLRMGKIVGIGTDDKYVPFHWNAGYEDEHLVEYTNTESIDGEDICFYDKHGNIILRSRPDSTIEVIELLTRILSVTEGLKLGDVTVSPKEIEQVVGLNDVTVKVDSDGISFVDQRGEIILKTRPDGTIETVELLSRIISATESLQFGNTALTEIPGWKIVSYDSEGFVDWGIKDNGETVGMNVSSGGQSGDILSKAAIKASMYLFSIYGQSLSLAGSQAADEMPVHTAPISNLFMFEGGVNSVNSVNPSTRTNTIVPLIEGPHSGTAYTKESLGFSAGATFLESLNAENGFVIDPANEFDMLVSSDGNGGMSVLQLSKGTSHYARWKSSMTAAVLRANELGKTLKVLSIVWVQGEQDIEDLTSKADYKARVIQLYNDQAADIKAITGQTEDPVFVMAQTASHNHYNLYPEIALAQYEMCLEQPNFELGSCLYHFDYQPNAGGMVNANVHMKRDSYMKMASDLSHVVKRRIVDGESKRFLYPKQFTVQGPVIEIVFNKNHGSLVFDTTIVADPGNYGFTMRSVSGTSGTVIPISSVKIVREDTVRIILSQAVQPGNSLTYGQNGLAQRDGRLVGPRGCLRDQTGDLAKRNIYDTEEYRLDRWCPIFEKIF